MLIHWVPTAHRVAPTTHTTKEDKVSFWVGWVGFHGGIEENVPEPAGLVRGTGASWQVRRL